VSRRENDDRDRDLLSPNRGHDLEPVAARQAQVQKNQIEALGCCSKERGFSRSLHGNVVLLRLQALAKRVSDFPFILDNQHAHELRV